MNLIVTDKFEWLTKVSVQYIVLLYLLLVFHVNKESYILIPVRSSEFINILSFTECKILIAVEWYL